MNTLSVPVIVISGICWYAGFYHLWMYLRRRKEVQNRSFAFLCFNIAFYNTFCFVQYNSTSVGQGIFWQHLQYASLGALGIFLTWFVYDITGYRSRKSLVFFGIWFTIFIVLGLTLRENPLTFTTARAAIKNIDLGFIGRFTMYEGQPGCVYEIQAISSYLWYIYIMIFLIKSYLKNRQKGLRTIIAAQFVFFAATINDSLVSFGWYSSIYLIEYAYMLIIVAMAHTLMNRFVDLHTQVEDLNISLEKKVENRTEELKSANQDLAIINQQLTETRDALWGEMEIAMRIQTLLVPREPVLDGYEVSTFMRPALSVGGDYHDVINVGGYSWIVIGDVTGHGVPAGLVMMMVQTSIHVVLDQNPSMKPSDLLKAVNITISRNMKLIDEEGYMTITALAVDKNGGITYSGLHQDILIYRAGLNRVESVPTRGFWLGDISQLMSDMGDDTIHLEKNDTILLHTDGITDALENGITSKTKNFTMYMYGVERLKKIMEENGMKSTQKIKEAIRDSLANYECNDDVTFMVLKRQI